MMQMTVQLNKDEMNPFDRWNFIDLSIIFISLSLLSL